MSIVKFFKDKKFSHGLRSISFLRRSCPFSHFATICMQKLYEALKRNGAQIRPHTCMQICTHPLLSFKYQIDMELIKQSYFCIYTCKRYLPTFSVYNLNSAARYCKEFCGTIAIRCDLRYGIGWNFA